MNTYKTLLAFLLALSDLDTPLSSDEKKILVEIGDQLDAQPLAWESYTQPHLLKMIIANPQLDQLYKTYQSQLNNTGDIPLELLPTPAEIQQLSNTSNFWAMKGFPPKSPPTGYDQQINNVVIVTSRSEQPETAVKKLPWEKIKHFLNNQYN
ncbi:MAG: hypothetical protein F6K36_26775 [Symploca sp. SIO3C6]|uniref:Uncharacterized protein n=1 Tax=Symploca sp. SIO1C4 TaxID=2607765 RepID=A0A6B3NEQ5_9CYAN|nr:hypothetical protein [Symploca sp. SIO3C6]NER29122.1 hypothetical protein [Symploca sp. SIO1C4]NET06784.1 hypothetical protein [Symploca sp. SIO2B6]